MNSMRRQLSFRLFSDETKSNRIDDIICQADIDFIVFPIEFDTSVCFRNWHPSSPIFLL